MLDVWTDTGTVDPGAYVGIACVPDSGIWCTGGVPTFANVALGDLPVPATNGTFCLVWVDGSCRVTLPGVKVVMGNDTARPLLAVQVLGVPVNVDAPVQCLAVIVPC